MHTSFGIKVCEGVRSGGPSFRGCSGFHWGMDGAEGTNSGTDTARKPDNAVEVDYGTGRLYRNVGFYEYPVTSYKFLNPGRLDADEKYKKNNLVRCPLIPYGVAS